MRLHGTTAGLFSAVRSASYFRNQPVRKDTVHFWENLAALARTELAMHPSPSSDDVRRLLVDLELEASRCRR
jgi:hypothetical protein